MPLSNPGTPMDEDGWADVLSDIRKLYLQINGGGNDLNNTTQDVTQVSDEFGEVQVQVCTEAGEKVMKVMGTQPE
jgi:flavoprotein